MAVVRSLSGRMVSFRLSDLPSGVLVKGANVALRREEDFAARLAIGALVDDPARSTRVHMVSADAWRRVMRE